ncbi:general transcription factor IIF subunit 1-like [Anneissia japonica]|uniref:general transcription factor IIF subunit 1-like n=1 Tax=Anneissia japonica TaxID=1529436 RepID=UPI00142551A8|nr:general transcription factor IIF subunit 1-like [Anneissia japonica]
MGSLPPVEDITNKLYSGQLTVLLMSSGHRGKWKKRFVVISFSHIYLYDKQSSKGKNKYCGAINLQDFKSCGPVNNKQLKKKYVIVVQPQDDNNQEWLFACDDPKTHEKWLHHINEAIRKQNPLKTRPVTVQFDDYTLETEVFESRLAKDRPKGPGRRAPTRKKAEESDAKSHDGDNDDTEEMKDEPNAAPEDNEGVTSADDGHYSSGTDEELDKEDAETEKPMVTDLKQEHFPKRMNTPPLGIASLTSNLAKEAAQKRLESRKEETDESDDKTTSNGHAQNQETNDDDDTKEVTDNDLELKRGPSFVRRLSNSFIKSFSGSAGDSDRKSTKKPPVQAPLKKPKPGLKVDRPRDRPNSLIVQGSPRMVSKLSPLHSPVASKGSKPIVSPKTPTDLREAVKMVDAVTQSSEKLIIKAKALRNAIKDLGGKDKYLETMHAIERNAKFALADIEDAITQLTKAQDELNNT